MTGPVNGVGRKDSQKSSAVWPRRSRCAQPFDDLVHGADGGAAAQVAAMGPAFRPSREERDVGRIRLKSRPRDVKDDSPSG